MKTQSPWLLHGLRVTFSRDWPRGQIGLVRAGRVLRIVKVGDPVEDAECDGAIVSPKDFEKLARGER